ncbi:MAG: hypothetical protein H8E41_07650 [Desulfobulbaceae bacterium]|uniref:Uncharacterized protein n=1 Tax=Candidatus Desulfobia pelagia TaxID=2841692 RepID=A0A8J6TCK7_9BACT|nr:hypothetical protein [Candidatus Desulfobia pelagia]
MPITKILDKPYSFLALFLSPWKDEATLHNLREALRLHKICWEQLLFTANSHRCTPLWYVQMRKDGFLEFLPEELQQYLDNLYELNVALFIRD